MHSMLTSFLGPIFAKEMVEMARRKRYFVHRVLYGTVLLFTVYLVWDRQRIGWRDHLSIQAMARLAQDLFQALSCVQYAAVLLFVPVFLCGVIASEREQGTLELLFTTRLTDREVVLGKLGSRLAVVVLLVLFTLPIISLVMLFGGVDPNAVWHVLACTLLAILYAGAHAIYFSTVTKSAMGALVRTYWWLAVWLFGVPMVVMMPTKTLVPTIAVLRVVETILLLINPLFLFALSLRDLPLGATTLLGEWYFPLAVVVPGGWSLFLLWRAVRRLRLGPTPLARFLSRMSMLRALGRDWRETMRNLLQRREHRAARLWIIFRVRNPLWLRARLTRVYDREGYIGRLQWLSWLAALFLLFMMLAFDRHGLTRRAAGFLFLGPVWIGVAVLIAVLAGTSLVGDRRRGFLDLVLTTPLRPREIIDGSLLAVWQHVQRSYWLPWLLGPCFILSGTTHPIGLACSLITASLLCALLAVYGTACSLAARTLPGALVPTFLFAITMTVGILFLIPIFRETACPAVWLMSAVLLASTGFSLQRRKSVGTRLALRRSISAALVGSHFLAVHLAFVSLATCWMWPNYYHENPILFMNPMWMTMVPLDSDPIQWFNDLPGQRWYQPMCCYWIALFLNLAWARWWLIRNFERLVERTDRPAPPLLLRSFRVMRAHPEALGSVVKE